MGFEQGWLTDHMYLTFWHFGAQRRELNPWIGLAIWEHWAKWVKLNCSVQSGMGSGFAYGDARGSQLKTRDYQMWKHHQLVRTHAWPGKLKNTFEWSKTLKWYSHERRRIRRRVPVHLDPQCECVTGSLAVCQDVISAGDSNDQEL